MVEPNPLPDSAKIHGEANLVGFSNGQQGIASGIIEGGFRKKKAGLGVCKALTKEVPTSKRQTII
jgi:iron complex outermembrane receptor protein